jgi:apolipoprotein D and lipocalin family protein
MKQRLIAFIFTAAALLMVSACTAVPDNVEPVSGFEIDRYLGKWYEIARLDHRFERGMDNVTAEYRLMDDGGVSVTNRGYVTEEQSWKQADGKAYFVDRQDKGHLKVSFFGPFYGSYVVFGLDQQDYQYAFVTSYDRSYLWLLSRQPVVSDEVINRFVGRAKELGYDTDKLIFVNQDRHVVGKGPLKLAHGVN